MIQLINPALGSVSGSLNVTETLAQNTMGMSWAAVGTGTTNVPAGAYRVRVFNTGLENIAVNGATVPPAEMWEVEARENRVTGRLDLCPAVTIVVPADGQASYQAETPSA